MVYLPVVIHFGGNHITMNAFSAVSALPLASFPWIPWNTGFADSAQGTVCTHASMATALCRVEEYARITLDLTTRRKELAKQKHNRNEGNPTKRSNVAISKRYAQVDALIIAQYNTSCKCM